MRYIESLGGPLILVPESSLPFWKGHIDDSNGDDYWRAGTVSSYIGAIPVGPGVALVLGDAPDPAAILPLDFGLGLHRWICADSDEHMERSLRESFANGFANERLEEEMHFDASGEKYILFDSVRSGLDRGDTLELLPPRGAYTILTMRCVSDRAESLIHLFKPLTNQP